MQKSLKRLDQFFWFYLMINPVLDIVNGVYIWIKHAAMRVWPRSTTGS